MASNELHEASADIEPKTREMHRAIASLIEELEAVDWYAQRIDATSDRALAAVLAHNRDEEKEHACMTLEWIRRRDEVFDRQLRRFLFKSGSILDAEESSETEAEEPGPAGDGGVSSLGIGSLRDQPNEP